MGTNSISFSLGRGAKSGPVGKIGFGIKAPQKATPISAVFGADDSDTEEQEVANHSAKRQRLESSVSAGPAPPQDPDVRKVVEKLAEFVAKNGRNFEEVTRQRNPEDSPFRFLYHKTSPEYLYYESRLLELEGGKRNSVGPGFPAALPQLRHAPASAQQPPQPAVPPPPRVNRFSETKPEVPEEAARAKAAQEKGDSLAAMEAYAKLAARKEQTRPGAEEDDEKPRVALLNETSFDRRRQVAVYKNDGKRGHHMQDFIPQEELAKLLAKSGSETAKAQAAALEEAQKIQADNVGHRMLQAMGWREGQGLGASASGIAAPIAAAAAKQPIDKGGLGARAANEIQEDDDEFEAYRKRMMLGYKHRPNPLGNPRKPYAS
ncbi:g8296 [Coccomyxa elongata]